MSEQPDVIPEDLVSWRDRLRPTLHDKQNEGLKIAEELDKALIYLSAGALIFSMTFVGTLAPARIRLDLLFCSWIAFGSSIVSVIFAMRTAQNLNVRALNEIAAALEKLNKLEQPEDNPRVLRTSKLIPWLNNLAIGAFIVGVALLVIFVALNLLGAPSSSPSPSPSVLAWLGNQI